MTLSTDLSDEPEKVDLYQYVLREVYELNLHIPDYQRIYCWDEKNVRCLLNDLSNHSSQDHEDIRYRLGRECKLNCVMLQ